MTDVLSPSPYAYLDALPPAERQSEIARRQHERREDWCDAARRARDYQAECAAFEQACVENADGYESMIADLRARIAELDQVTERLSELSVNYSDELERALARIAELEAALEPFASEADHYEPDEGDNAHAAWASDFTIGSLRRARAALRNR